MPKDHWKNSNRKKFVQPSFEELKRESSLERQATELANTYVRPGNVLGKCSVCGRLAEVHKNAWRCDVDSKPKCGCGGKVYLANPSSVVTDLS